MIYSKTRQLFINFITSVEDFFFSEEGRIIDPQKTEQVMQELSIYINDELCVV